MWDPPACQLPASSLSQPLGYRIKVEEPRAAPSGQPARGEQVPAHVDTPTKECKAGKGQSSQLHQGLCRSKSESWACVSGQDRPDQAWQHPNPQAAEAENEAATSHQSLSPPLPTASKEIKYSSPLWELNNKTECITGRRQLITPFTL